MVMPRVTARPFANKRQRPSTIKVFSKLRYCFCQNVLRSGTADFSCEELLLTPEEVRTSPKVIKSAWLTSNLVETRTTESACSLFALFASAPFPPLLQQNNVSKKATVGMLKTRKQRRELRDAEPDETVLSLVRILIFPL